MSKVNASVHVRRSGTERAVGGDCLLRAYSPIRAASILVSFVVCVFMLSGFKLSAMSAIKSADNAPTRVEIVASRRTDQGEAIVFEDVETGAYGVVLLTHTLGFLWRNNGGSYGHVLDVDEPFEAAGLLSQHGNKRIFIVGVKVGDSTLRYVALGVGDSTISIDPAAVRQHESQVGQLPAMAVNDGYALFVVNDYNPSTWSVGAFDSKGDLVAYQPFGSSIPIRLEPAHQ